MNIEAFDKTAFSKYTEIIYKDKVYPLVSIDFGKKWVRIRLNNKLQWVRCEDIEIEAEVQMQLKSISEAAIRGNRQLVCELLNNTKLSYRIAYMYLERFYGDNKASLLIQECGKCKCGSVATIWNPNPICVQCSFSKSMEKIEYK